MSGNLNLDRASRLNRFYAFTLAPQGGSKARPGWAHKFHEIAQLLSFSNPCDVDAKTFAAKVSEWQKENGITPFDGVIGQKTWAAMTAIIAGRVAMSGPLPMWLAMAAPFSFATSAFCGLGSIGSNAVIPARGFLFVLGHVLPEVGQRNLVSRVAIIPNDLILHPTNRWASLSATEHVIQMGAGESQFINASNMPHGGIQNIMGDKKGVLIDIQKVKRAGGKVITPKQLVSLLEIYRATDPYIDFIINQVKNEAGWALVKGPTPEGAVRPLSPQHMKYLDAADQIGERMQAAINIVPEHTDNVVALHTEKAAKLSASYNHARMTGRVLRGFSAVGFAVTAYEIGSATKKSIDERSFRPIGAETIRQTGGWASAAAGAKLGFATGAAVGIETGPGAIITGAVGAIVVGALGYFGADCVADYIYEN